MRLRAVSGIRRSGLVAGCLVPLALLTSLAPAGTAAAAGTGSSDIGNILLVVDVSGSMLEPDRQGTAKIDGAKQALTTLVRELPEGVPVGLRVFGEDSALAATRASCTDSRLAVPVGPLTLSGMSGSIAGLRARGWTPIGYALGKASGDLPSTGRGSVVLVSDGIDECYPKLGPEPCKVAASLTRTAVDLKVHTIGLTVNAAARTQLKCIARVTGGKYWDADDAGSLAAALRASILPPRAAPPPEPASANLLGPFAVLVATAAAAIGAGAAMRSMLRRRRRAYW